MAATPKVGDIDEEDNILTTKIKLTKNEYSATIRNKLEYNRLSVVTKHITDQNDITALKMRTSMHDLKQWLGDNQRVVCNIDEFFSNRQVQSANPKLRSRPPGVHSGFARPGGDGPRNRVKSVSTLSRPNTAPVKLFHGEQSDPDDTESDDEIIPISISRVTSAKRVGDRSSTVSSSVLSHHPPESTVTNNDTLTSAIQSGNHRITWPVKLRVFALQDENEARQQFLNWRAEQRKSKIRRSSKTFFDVDLERQYQQSIRRRQEIEAFLTPDLIEDAKANDPIFAKRYRQLRLAVKAGKLPTYDPNDREINVNMTKSKIERARTALITAKQSKIKSLYRIQQSKNDAILSKRIDTFLKRVAKLKDDEQQELSSEV